MSTLALAPSSIAPASSNVSKVASTGLDRLTQLFAAKVNISREFLEHGETLNAYTALDQLYNTKGEFYTSTIVDEYLTAKRGGKFHYLDKGVVYQTKEFQTPFQVAMAIEKSVYENSAITDIALPYNNKGHHVVIYIDRCKKRVEYYDPFGTNSRDPKSERGLHFSMQEQLQAIYRLFFNGAALNIIENPTEHQKCKYRCAIWSLHYIDKRLEGLSAEHISATPFTNDDVDRYKIETVARTIEERARRLIQLKPKEAPLADGQILIPLDDDSE